jgi:hypothetical protein
MMSLTSIVLPPLQNGDVIVGATDQAGPNESKSTSWSQPKAGSNRNRHRHKTRGGRNNRENNLSERSSPGAKTFVFPWLLPFSRERTLSEFAEGDTYGSIFGVTRNPYDLERTVGGSSGGSGAALAANFSTVTIGEETVASIRRPAPRTTPASPKQSRAGCRSGVCGAAAWRARETSGVATLIEVASAELKLSPNRPTRVEAAKQ